MRYSFSFFYPILAFSFLLIAYAVSYPKLKKVSRVFLAISGLFLVGVVFVAMPFLFVFISQYRYEEMFGPEDLPLVVATGVMVLGVFFYIRSRHVSQAQLLKDHRKYQLALWKAALGMVKVKELSRLLGLIVRVIIRSVRVEHCSIYVYHDKAQRYVLKASGGSRDGNVEAANSIFEDSSLVEYMQRIQRPVVYEEVVSLVDGGAGNGVIGGIVEIMDRMSASVVLPGFIDGRLAIFIVLGEKRSGKLFSSDELMAFSMLCNHAALVIENVSLREDIHNIQERLLKAEKMAVLGTIADGVSHQINNRLHSIGFIAGDAIDTIRMGRRGDGSMNMMMDKLYGELEYALNRIQVNVRQGGEVLVGLLGYSRNGSNGFSAVDLNRLLDASIEMAQFKMMDNILDFIRKFGNDVPKLKGNFTQLQEVFFNIIDNSYEAIVQRNREFNDLNYRGRVEFSFFEKDGMGHIVITDNGIGVKESDIHRLFDPFYSTKAEQGKGTGLGLYIIKKIIEDIHKGTVLFRSEYGKGSQVEVVLSVIR